MKRRWETLDSRRLAHIARLAAWQALSPKEQLAELAGRPGKSLKQSQRLAAKQG